MILHTYTSYPISLPLIKFLHLMVPEIQPGKDFTVQGHHGKVKGWIKVIPWHCTPTPLNQCPYQVSTSYTLWFLRYSPDKNLKVKVTVVRTNVKSRSHHDLAHLHSPMNIPTKFQLPTPYGVWDTVWISLFLPPACPFRRHGWKQYPDSP